jgi:hypothetical protein
LKYIGFYEMNQEDKYQVFELDEKLIAEYRQDKEKWEKKYGKVFEGPYFLGMEPKGITLFEFETQEQMINMERAYWPIKRWRFVPLIEVDKVKEIYMKKKEET